MQNSPKTDFTGQTLFPNPPVKEVASSSYPSVSENTFIGFNSLIIGDVTIDEDVFVGFFNLIRADSAAPFYIGRRSNIQDFVVIHSHPGQHIVVNDKKVAVHIEAEVSILHHTIPHGPLYIGHNTYIGHHVSIYGGVIGKNCVIMHHASISNHVNIANDRFVAPGQVIESQEQADLLPLVPQEYKMLNSQIVEHYDRLRQAYQSNSNLGMNFG